MASLVDRLSGWWIDRVLFARKRYQRAAQVDTRQPQRLAVQFMERTGQAGAWAAGETVDVDAVHALAATSAWAYSDIQLIAGRVASQAARPVAARWVNGKLQEERDHPMSRLLANPNPFMTGSFLFRYTAWWYLLHGNAYIFVSTPSLGRGEPMELWPLVARRVTPRPDLMRETPWGLTIDYDYEVNGQIDTLPGEHVIHFRTANPWDYWRGLSPLTAGQLAVQTDHNRGRWDVDFFGKDNAMPTAVISLPETITDSDFERAQEEIRSEFGGRRRTAITRAGDMSIETIQQTLQDMQLIEGREFSRKEIDRVYGVPEGLISGGLSGDSRLAAETAFALNTIQPMTDYMAEEFTIGLAAFYGDDLVCQAPSIVPRDKALAIQEYTIFGQDRSVNENRAELGLDAFVHPLADVPVRLLTVIASGAETAGQPGVASMSGADAPENVVAREAAKAAPTEAEEEGWRMELKRWQRVALRELRAGRSPAERPFESTVLPERLRIHVATTLATAGDENTVRTLFRFAGSHFFLEHTTKAEDPFDKARTAAERAMQRAFRAGHDDLGAIDDVATGTDPAQAFGPGWSSKYQQRLQSRVVPALSTAATQAAEEIAGYYGIAWDLVNTEVLAWAHDYGYNLVSGLVDTTQKQLQKEIADWIESGEHLDVLTDKLTALFKNPVRAQMVASTEITRLYQMANEAGWRRANVELGAGIVGGQWRTAVDELVCDICGPMDGETRPLDSQYMSPDTGEMLLMPAHVRCRCWETPVLTKPGDRRPGPGPVVVD